MSITVRSVLLLVFCCVFLLLSPVRVYGQSYSGTASALSYGYYNGANRLYMFSEWFYPSGGSGSYMWSGEAVKFELVVSKYYSLAHFQANDAISTDTVTYIAASGEWMVQQWNQDTVRVSGAKYVDLEQGYYFHVVLNPKAVGNYRTGYYQPWNQFVWTGQQQSASIDLTHP